MNNIKWSVEQPFQALALTGGGFRGIFAAQALQCMEEHIGHPVGRHFDISCGTSIGGIVALAVAFEVPMKKVVDVFTEHGEAIFPSHTPPEGKWQIGCDLFKHRNRPRYSSVSLRQAIASLIPEGAVLGDALHPVAIPAVNVTEGRPQVFKTRHKQEWHRDWKLKAIDVALATSAAPTFFGLAEVSGSLYSDGGLFANAPDLIAFHEAEYYFGVPVDAVRILSIGTTTKSYSISFNAGREFGVADWMQDARLFSVMISAQQQFVDQLMAHRLGDRYLRLDKEPSQEQASDLGLDIATPVAIRTLKALATKATTDLIGNRLDGYLSHTPQLKIFGKDNG
ncbi:CBASS cGAMP-activated phospholipase [Candidatus Nitrotoga sp. 1052]|uniref:CBASS cGAMP-activated phospholipase n=1 Tax=Candidatus Nitrotoga sp. 1052 TaxID=2886964 RepID=UPI001EF60A2D|nr:CBASS cGAMP-activated phospholipase [Candidatus Nitrotoga sp. 1052]CAH1073338.1 PNPLA domain-containing protein [Candidatus Nitrotoga sp. 1052]